MTKNQFKTSLRKKGLGFGWWNGEFVTTEETYNERIKREYKEIKERRKEGFTFRTWDEVYKN